jgi:hypothetical protein
MENLGDGSLFNGMMAIYTGTNPFNMHHWRSDSHWVCGPIWELSRVVKA